MPEQTPAMYFEDFTVGDRWDLGTAELTREEMLEFARRYDPEPLHVDEAAAGEGRFDGLIGSGLLTLAKCRLLDQRFFSRRGARFQVAAGFRYLDFAAPSRPGDVIRVSSECTGKRPSRTRPEIGLVTFKITAANQRDERLLEFAPVVLVQRGAPAAP